MPAHAKAAKFMRELSNAFFVRVETDEAALRQFHAAGGRGTLSSQQLDDKDVGYWNRRMRRIVPEPSQLEAALEELLERYRDCRDITIGGAQLLTPLTYEVHAAALSLIKEGRRDLMALDRMYKNITKPGGRPTYINVRGTSQLEGHHTTCTTCYSRPLTRPTWRAPS